MTNILSILTSTQAILTNDHFVYTSGTHGAVYINKDALYTQPRKAAQVGRLLAKACQDLQVDTVVAPALGGIVLAQWTTFYLSKLRKTEIASVYAEKLSDGSFRFTRGYDVHVRSKRVLVLEDLVNTGGSVQKVIDVVKKTGGTVVAACVMVHRQPGKVTAQSLGVPELRALGEFPAETWLSENCPLCAKGIPINTKIGHGGKKKT